MKIVCSSPKFYIKKYFQEIVPHYFSAVDAGITILNEVGLDPGIDHMTAMECFDEVQNNGGKVRTGMFIDGLG